MYVIFSISINVFAWENILFRREFFCFRCCFCIFRCLYMCKASSIFFEKWVDLRAQFSFTCAFGGMEIDSTPLMRYISKWVLTIYGFKRWEKRHQSSSIEAVWLHSTEKLRNREYTIRIHLIVKTKRFKWSFRMILSELLE